MAMERVERRLLRVTAALDASTVPYAVVGGNAVSAWVATRDPSATRTTRDVDLLVNRTELDSVTAALETLAFRRENAGTLTLFVDPEEPNRRSGVHLVWAGEKVRPSNPHAAPLAMERVREKGDKFWLIALPALLRMKPTSFRPLDQAHILDMLGVGLIDDAVRMSLPPDLRDRLQEIEAHQDEWT